MSLRTITDRLDALTSLSLALIFPVALALLAVLGMELASVWVLHVAGLVLLAPFWSPMEERMSDLDSGLVMYAAMFGVLLAATGFARVLQLGLSPEMAVYLAVLYGGTVLLLRKYPVLVGVIVLSWVVVFVI